MRNNSVIISIIDTPAASEYAVAARWTHSIALELPTLTRLARISLLFYSCICQYCAGTLDCFCDIGRGCFGNLSIIALRDIFFLLTWHLGGERFLIAAVTSRYSFWV